MSSTNNGVSPTQPAKYPSPLRMPNQPLMKQNAGNPYTQVSNQGGGGSIRASDMYMDMLQMRPMEFSSMAGVVDDTRSNNSSSPGLNSERSQSPGVRYAGSDAGSVSSNMAYSMGGVDVQSSPPHQSPGPFPPQHMSHGSGPYSAFLTPATPTAYAPLGGIATGSYQMSQQPTSAPGLDLHDLIGGGQADSDSIKSHNPPAKPNKLSVSSPIAKKPTDGFHTGQANTSSKNPYREFLAQSTLFSQQRGQLSTSTSSEAAATPSFDAYKRAHDGRTVKASTTSPDSSRRTEMSLMSSQLGPDGDYGFKIVSWEDEELLGQQVSKGVPHTYSSKTNTMYVKRMTTFDIVFGVQERVPPVPNTALYVSVSLDFGDNDWKEEMSSPWSQPVRCPAHVHLYSKDKLLLGNRERHNVVSNCTRCHYINMDDHIEMRFPFEQNVVKPAPGTVLNNTQQLMFTCYNSCPTVHRRATKLVCSLIRVPLSDPDTECPTVLGSAEVNTRTCACPGRDRPHLEGPQKPKITKVDIPTDGPPAKRLALGKPEADEEGMYEINKKVKGYRNFLLITRFIAMLENEDDWGVGSDAASDRSLGAGEGESDREMGVATPPSTGDEPTVKAASRTKLLIEPAKLTIAASPFTAKATDESGKKASTQDAATGKNAMDAN